MSETGACVELSERVKSRMPLRLSLRTDCGRVEAEARVVWAEEQETAEGGILHGMAFTEIIPGQLQALQDLFISHGHVRPGGVRLPFEVAVTCHPTGATESIQGRTHDLSRDGLLLRLARIVPPETPLEVTLHTLHGAHTVRGVVVWVAPPEGRTPGGPIRHGFRFTATDRSTMLNLSRLLVESG